MAEARPRSRLRRLLRRSFRIWVRVVGVASILVVILAWISTDHFKAFGGSPDESTRARMRSSPRFSDNEFHNVEPTGMLTEGSTGSMLNQYLFGHEMRAPVCPLPLITDTAVRLASPAPSGLRVTWLGHSTTLIEIDGATLLTDPIWSERASPSRWLGPRRFHPPPLALSDLPRVDAVLVSHEHYDHLDMATIRALASRGVPFHVPLGLGAHLLTWGVPSSQIVEHDWWEAAVLPNGVRVISTPARHFYGRGVPFRTGTLWTSWSLVGPRHRAFFSGDTGLTEAFREIAAREGPFDVALLEIGQWHPSWGSIHLGPLGALEAHARLGAKTLIPIHWATFELGMHDWSEPAETLTTEAEKRGVSLRTPRLGEPVEPTLPPTTTAWWRALPPTAARCP